jgi:hypothetical protein
VRREGGGAGGGRGRRGGEGRRRGEGGCADQHESLISVDTPCCLLPGSASHDGRSMKLQSRSSAFGGSALMDGCMLQSMSGPSTPERCSLGLSQQHQRILAEPSCAIRR